MTKSGHAYESRLLSVQWQKGERVTTISA